MQPAVEDQQHKGVVQEHEQTLVQSRAMRTTHSKDDPWQSQTEILALHCKHCRHPPTLTTAKHGEQALDSCRYSRLTIGCDTVVRAAQHSGHNVTQAADLA